MGDNSTCLLSTTEERAYGRDIAARFGPTPRTLGLVFGRHIDGGMHGDIDITNYGPEPGSRQPALDDSLGRSSPGGA